MFSWYISDVTATVYLTLSFSLFSSLLQQSITSIDESLHDQPTLDYRRDTAAAAALSLSYRNQKEVDNQTEENNQDTSIDDILGPRTMDTDKESDMSDEGSQRTGSPSDSNSVQAPSPEPEAAPVNDEVPKSEESESTVEEVKKEGEDERSESKPPIESSETPENQTNAQSSDDVVVTSVTVEVNGDAPVAVCDESECKIKNQKDEEKEAPTDDMSKTEGESQEAKEPGEASENNGESTLAVEQEAKEGGEGEVGEGVEVLITRDQRSNSFSVTVANIDTDDYSSSEDEGSQSPPYIEPSAESEAAATKSSSQEVTSSEEPPKANGDCPTITVETEDGEKKGANNEEGKQEKRNSSASNSSTEGERLSPQPERRRCKCLMATRMALHEIFGDVH